GITAVAGAPYHGKSTLVSAIAAGGSDHAPGDGRERVVAIASAVAVQADDGRRIKDQDVSAFFARLPGARARRFSTDRASGATSMAASVLQACAAGCRLLLVDEDSAASNFLSIDAGMRRLLGRSLTGITTLLEALPALAAKGVSTVIVAGSSTASLAVADTTLVMDHFQPRTVAHRLARARARRIRSVVNVPERLVADAPDCILGPRHFLDIHALEPERPIVAGVALDLRRSGWELDAALARGACAAAAWCARLVDAGDPGLAMLRLRYEAFIAERGPCALDPFHTTILVVPPWQLVVSVLERMPRPYMRCVRRTRKTDADRGGTSTAAR
nr:hypothetical protein [Planctomycetota bacterium]